MPLDFGATVMTSIHIDAYQSMRNYLGLPQKKDIAILDKVQEIVVVDEDVEELLGVDTRGVGTRPWGEFIPEIKDDKEGYTYFYDDFGIGWHKPDDGGFFYDMFYHPFNETLTIDEVEKFPWPDPIDPKDLPGMGERARHAAEVEKKAVVVKSLGPGILETTTWMLGFEKFYISTITDIDLINWILDIILEIKTAYWEQVLTVLGDYADVIVEADDLGSQNQLLFSPEVYRKHFKPRHKKLFDFIHKHTDAKLFLHCCGAIRPVIPDLIEVGVDILNPVQVSAKGMDSAELKRDFGKDLVFWGGGVDHQRVLGLGSPQDVRDDVKKRIDDLAPGGGFVFATIHNIQANDPPENIVAMWETLRDYGIY